MKCLNSRAAACASRVRANCEAPRFAIRRQLIANSAAACWISDGRCSRALQPRCDGAAADEVDALPWALPWRYTDAPRVPARFNRSSSCVGCVARPTSPNKVAGLPGLVTSVFFSPFPFPPSSHEHLIRSSTTPRYCTQLHPAKPSSWRLHQSPSHLPSLT